MDTTLSQGGHIDAVAHFKTKLNYKRAAAVYSSPASDPRGLLSTSTHRKLHPDKKNRARSLGTCLRPSARSGPDLQEPRQISGWWVGGGRPSLPFCVMGRTACSVGILQGLKVAGIAMPLFPGPPSSHGPRSPLARAARAALALKCVTDGTGRAALPAWVRLAHGQCRLGQQRLGHHPA